MFRFYDGIRLTNEISKCAARERIDAQLSKPKIVVICQGHGHSDNKFYDIAIGVVSKVRRPGRLTTLSITTSCGDRTHFIPTPLAHIERFVKALVETGINGSLEDLDIQTFEQGIYDEAKRMIENACGNLQKLTVDKN